MNHVPATLGGPMGRLPSRVFAVTYLLLIPLFALIYRQMPGQFYHSTLQFETTSKQDEVRLLADIKRSIDRTYATHGLALIEKAGYKFQILDIELTNLAIETAPSRPESRIIDLNPADNIVSFDMFGALSAPVGSASISFHRLRVAIEPKLQFFNPPSETYWKADIGSDPELPFPPSMILSPSASDTNSQPLVFVHPVNLGQRIRNYCAAKRGFPTGGSGGFWRMFYFSAMTITTVGYGDIVPITTPARILTAVEAILGVVLIGLFLNSLFTPHHSDRS